MPITYTGISSDESIYASQAKGTRAQLQNLQRQIDVLKAEAERDVYNSVPRLKLPPLLQLRSELEARLMRQEGRTGVATSTGGSWNSDVPAYSSGSYFTGHDR